MFPSSSLCVLFRSVLTQSAQREKMLLLYKRSLSVFNLVGTTKLFYARDFVENNVDYWHRQVGSFFSHTK